jgi:hypothetical protein
MNLPWSVARSAAATPLQKLPGVVAGKVLPKDVQNRKLGHLDPVLSA